MTSDPSQQHGWQHADRDEHDDAQQQRGFGLFEAPSAPDEFPAFTAYSSASASDAGGVDDFPPDSDGFAGFPSDDSPLSNWSSSSSSEPYVPAPAVMPIPGVRHDPESLGPSTPWSSSSELDGSGDDWSSSSSELDREDSLSGGAGSWKAFAAGESPKLSPAPTPMPWEESSDRSLPSYEYEAPPAAPVSFQSVADAVSAPYYSSSDSYQSASDAGSSYQSASDSYQSASDSYQSASEAVSSSYQSASDLAPSFQAPEPASAPPPPPPTPPAAYAPPFAEPGAPYAPPTPPPASGTARVSAAVPAPNRMAPGDGAPGAAAPMPNRPQGRVYGSAAATGGAVVASSMPDAASSMPGVSEAVAPAGVPGASPPPPAGMPESTGAVRATARASVAVAKPEPGDAPPPATRSSTVYGTPVNAAAAAAPAAPPRQGRQPAYGDLLGPAPTSPGAMGEAPPMLVGGAAAVPAQRSGPPPLMPGQPQPQPMGPPPPHGHAGPNASPSMVQRASASVPPARDGDQAKFDQFTRQSGAGEQAAPAEPKPERKGRIIVGVLIGCVALLAVAFGGLILVDKLFNGPTFAVGDCVKPNGKEAVQATCTEAGAFKVTASVSSSAQCEDQTQPHVEQGTQILCLAPANAPSAGSTPTTNPTPTASP